MIQVGGVPCIYRIVADLMKQGFHDITLLINTWMKPFFEHEFRDLENVRFMVTNSPKGTAGELFHAKDLITSEFMVLYGDDLTFVDFGDLQATHWGFGNDATIVGTTNLPLEVGVLEVEGGLLKSFQEKPQLGKPSWTGIAVFEEEMKEYFRDGEDIAHDVFPRMLADGRRVGVYLTDSLWVDTGNIQHLRKANEHFKRSD